MSVNAQFSKSTGPTAKACSYHANHTRTATPHAKPTLVAQFSDQSFWRQFRRHRGRCAHGHALNRLGTVRARGFPEPAQVTHQGRRHGQEQKENDRPQYGTHDYPDVFQLVAHLKGESKRAGLCFQKNLG